MSGQRLGRRAGLTIMHNAQLRGMMQGGLPLVTIFYQSPGGCVVWERSGEVSTWLEDYPQHRIIYDEMTGERHE